MTEKNCKLDASKNGYVSQYVIPELMTEKISKLTVQQNEKNIYKEFLIFFLFIILIYILEIKI
jgi:hypothetical protein